MISQRQQTIQPHQCNAWKYLHQKHAIFSHVPSTSHGCHNHTHHSQTINTSQCMTTSGIEVLSHIEHDHLTRFPINRFSHNIPHLRTHTSSQTISSSEITYQDMVYVIWSLSSEISMCFVSKWHDADHLLHPSTTNCYSPSTVPDDYYEMDRWDTSVNRESVHDSACFWSSTN